MQDPCNPPPHHAHPFVHHHPPGGVIGRIRRHGTHRIAQRLHAVTDACAAGPPPLLIGAATFKAVLPAAAFLGLTTLTSSVVAPADQSATGGFGAEGGGSFGGAGGVGSVGVVAHKHSPHPPVPISVPEPPSFALLLLVTFGWMGIRFGLRRGRATPSCPSDPASTQPLPGK